MRSITSLVSVGTLVGHRHHSDPKASFCKDIHFPPSVDRKALGTQNSCIQSQPDWLGMAAHGSSLASSLATNEMNYARQYGASPNRIRSAPACTSIHRRADIPRYLPEIGLYQGNHDASPINPASTSESLQHSSESPPITCSSNEELPTTRHWLGTYLHRKGVRHLWRRRRHSHGLLWLGSASQLSTRAVPSCSEWGKRVCASTTEIHSSTDI